MKENAGEVLHPLTLESIKSIYNSPRELKIFLEENSLGMRKKFGQNFLINPNIRERLLDALEIKPLEKVWEIGPGLGAMTMGLLERGAELTAFEIDRGFINILKELFSCNNNFNLVEGDVLKTWPKISRENNISKHISLFGNLPYNIAAILLADFIEKKFFFNKMVITVQFETAQRLMAKPGTKDYSSLTVLCNSVYKIRPLMKIKGPSFYPIPRVESQALRFDLIPLSKELPKYFNPLTRVLFTNRRKTIKNNMLNFVYSVIEKYMKTTNKQHDVEQQVSNIVSNALEKMEISGNIRAETLDINGFIRLAEILEELIGNE